MVLPAGLAPATVSFEASRADLLRYGSVNCDLKVIRPRATELLLTPSFCRRPAVDSGDGPALKLNAGSGRNWLPHLESHQDLRFQRPSCYCCTTGQESGVALLPEGNRTTIYWRCFIPMESASDLARRRVPGSFPWLHRNQVSALECILYS